MGKETLAEYEFEDDTYDFGGYGAQTYKETCKCGREIEISTQSDNNPEFYARIYVRCVCGKSVAFDLPVN